MNDEKIINLLGGPAQLSKELSIAGGKYITPQAISAWKKNGIPSGWLAYIKVVHSYIFVTEHKKVA